MAWQQEAGVGLHKILACIGLPQPVDGDKFPGFKDWVEALQIDMNTQPSSPGEPIFLFPPAGMEPGTLALTLANILGTGYEAWHLPFTQRGVITAEGQSLRTVGSWEPEQVILTDETVQELLAKLNQES